MFDKMLSDKIVSPRTYNMKKKEIEERLKYEKLELKQKFQEAKTVLGYFEDLSSQESEHEKKEKELLQSDHLRDAQTGGKQLNFRKDKNIKGADTHSE